MCSAVYAECSVLFVKKYITTWEFHWEKKKSPLLIGTDQTIFKWPLLIQRTGQLLLCACQLSTLGLQIFRKNDQGNWKSDTLVEPSYKVSTSFISYHCVGESECAMHWWQDSWIVLSKIVGLCCLRQWGHSRVHISHILTHTLSLSLSLSLCPSYLACSLSLKQFLFELRVICLQLCMGIYIMHGECRVSWHSYVEGYVYYVTRDPLARESQ